MIQENIENLKNKINELENHPLCLKYDFDNRGRLTIILPEGYRYNRIAQGFRLNESSKIKNVEKALIMCEDTWKESLACFNL